MRNEYRGAIKSLRRATVMKTGSKVKRTAKRKQAAPAKGHPAGEQLMSTLRSPRMIPIAYRRLDIKANGEAHLKEYGVAPMRWVVILVIFCIVILRLKDPTVILGALAKLAHIP